MFRDNCPKCKAKLEGEKISCADCGWSARKDKSQQRDEGGFRTWPDICDFRVDHLQCRFPAVFSPNTRGGGPYYCRFHSSHQSHAMEAAIVQESQIFKAKTHVDKDNEFDKKVGVGLKESGINEKQIERMRQFCREGALKLAGKGRI